MPYVTDAHALVWYFIGSPCLSQKALEIFRDSAAGREIIVIPSIVLGEILHISEKGRVPASFEEIVTRIETGDNYEVAALDLHLLKVASEIKVGLSLHDRLIVATAQSLGLPLITRDEAIVAAGIVKTVW